MSNPTLQCPNTDCAKPLVNMGSHITRIGKVPLWIHRHRIKLVLLLTLPLSPIIFVAGAGLAAGYAGAAVLLFPFFLTHVVERSFSIYRVTHCPHCGYKDAQKLGLNMMVATRDLSALTCSETKAGSKLLPHRLKK